MTEKENKIETQNKNAVLVGVLLPESDPDESARSLAELERLLDTAGGICVGKVVQAKENPDPRTFIGSGKIVELKELCGNSEASLVVFDDDLTPSQIKNIEDELDGPTVIDRSMLILDIFALHATTSEGKLQIELAQLKYTAPRLIGKGVEMSRLAGGIGTRGPGESKLETDRRHLKRRVEALEAELSHVDSSRRTMRSARDRSGIAKAAIVGYTNAGKSTLLNYLTGAGILAEDKLFATLDPTTRKYTLPGGENVLLTDTVGFIRKLPHHLIKAFKSTLDEAVYADVLIVLADASDPEYRECLDVTEKLLEELGAGGKPIIYVFNKCDRNADTLPVLPEKKPEDVIYISALSGKGVDRLISRLESVIREGKTRCRFIIPNSEQSALSVLYASSAVESVEYGDESVSAVAVVDEKTRGRLSKYLEKL